MSSTPRLRLWLASARLGLGAVIRSPGAWLASAALAIVGGDHAFGLAAAGYAAAVAAWVHRAVHGGLFRAGRAEARAMLSGLAAGAAVPGVLGAAAGLLWQAFGEPHPYWNPFADSPVVLPLTLLTPALVAAWVGVALGWGAQTRAGAGWGAFATSLGATALAMLGPRELGLRGDMASLMGLAVSLTSGQLALLVAGRLQPAAAPPEPGAAPRLAAPAERPERLSAVTSDEGEASRPPSRERVR